MTIHCIRCGAKMTIGLSTTADTRTLYTCPRCGQSHAITTVDGEIRVSRVRSYRVRAEYK